MCDLLGLGYGGQSQQSKSAGSGNHGALREFLGITSEGLGFEPAMDVAEATAFAAGLVGTMP